MRRWGLGLRLAPLRGDLWVCGRRGQVLAILHGRQVGVRVAVSGASAESTRHQIAARGGGGGRELAWDQAAPPRKGEAEEKAQRKNVTTALAHKPCMAVGVIFGDAVVGGLLDKRRVHALVVLGLRRRVRLPTARLRRRVLVDIVVGPPPARPPLLPPVPLVPLLLRRFSPLRRLLLLLTVAPDPPVPPPRLARPPAAIRPRLALAPAGLGDLRAGKEWGAAWTTRGQRSS